MAGDARDAGHPKTSRSTIDSREAFGEGMRRKT